MSAVALWDAIRSTNSKIAIAVDIENWDIEHKTQMLLHFTLSQSTAHRGIYLFSANIFLVANIKLEYKNKKPKLKMD